MEEIILNLIMHSGEARSYAMEAMEKAKKGNIDEAKALIEKSSQELVEAHHSQTKLIQGEAGGEKAERSLREGGEQHRLRAGRRVCPYRL